MNTEHDILLIDIEDYYTSYIYLSLINCKSIEFNYHHL